MNISTGDYWNKLKGIAELIQNAESLLIGVGSGMTASGGLSYTDPVLAQKWYPEYFEQGDRSIIEIMHNFWPNTVNEKNAARFWGFWAKHIFHIRYEPAALKPYLDLYNIAKDKDYFICTTNVDGQLEKAGFDRKDIFSPQGDYALFQCTKPCTKEAYDNKEMIRRMLEHMVSPFEIHTDDIPRCPKCGRLLMPNLRCDDSFVEKPHVKNFNTYKTFIQKAFQKTIVLLELGVGFNTPVIIRYPFEAITLQYPNAKLIRVNTAEDIISDNILDKSVFIQEDIGKVLADILNAL